MATDGTPRQIRAFATLLLAMAGVGGWRLARRGVDPRAVLIGAGVVTMVALVGLVVPPLLAPAYRAWMALAHAMGLVTTPIVLTAVYLVVFTPVRGVMVLFGKDPLLRRWNGAARTYWIPRARTRFRAEDFEHLA